MIEFLLSEPPKGSLLREEVPDESVGIFDRSAFGGAVGMGEVNGDVGGGGEEFVVTEFRAVINPFINKAT